MNADQILTLLVLGAVVAALIWDRLRADIVALAGAAFLLMTGIVPAIGFVPMALAGTWGAFRLTRDA